MENAGLLRNLPQRKLTLEMLRDRPWGPSFSRAWPSAVAGLVGASLIVYLAWNSGGYFASSYLLAGAIAWACVAALLVVRPPYYRLATSALLAVGALAALTAWTGLSVAWSASPDNGLADMQQMAVYVGFFALALLAGGSGRLSARLVWGALGVTVLIAGGGLLSRLYPDIVAPSATLIYRLGYPLAYWNALGALAAMGAILAAGLASDNQAARASRGVATGLGVLLVTVVYLSLSRGAFIALAVGVIVLIALSPNRWVAVTSLLIISAAAAPAILIVASYPALTDSPTLGAGQQAAGHAAGPWVFALAALAGVVQAGAVVSFERSPAAPSLARLMRPVLSIVVGLVVVAGALVYVADPHPIDRRASSVEATVRRQWNDFLRPAVFAPSGAARLSTTATSRGDVYRVALDSFSAHPFFGAGAGSFPYLWFRGRHNVEQLRNAHSVYLETMAELGFVGLGLLLLFAGAVLVAAVRASLRRGPVSRARAAGVTAALAVWFVHSGIDWDWQVSALTGVALFMAASILPEGRRRRRRTAEAADGVEPSALVS
jgi:hypothetical protein